MEKIYTSDALPKLSSNIYSDNISECLSDASSFDINRFCDFLLKRNKTDISWLSPEEKFWLLKNRALYLLPENELLEKLKKSHQNNTPLTVKFGIDPTGSQVHLWHAVPMVMLNRLQRMWHDIVFIIWDFTAKIGDPTGRSTERPTLTDEQIQENLSTYKEQVSPFFDMSKSKVLYNSEWLKNTTLDNLINTLSDISVSSVLQRNDFRERIEKKQWLSMSEILYPIVMWLDSVNLQKETWCDIELWGKDQFLNMKMCRTLMGKNWQTPEVIVSTDILEWISGGGLKMSKSLNNYIALNDSPENIYGKIMSIPDNLLEIYYKSLTEISNEEWKQVASAMSSWIINPMNIKKGLAKILVSTIYNKEKAENAIKTFRSKFSNKDYWKLDLKQHNVSWEMSFIDFLTEKFQKSRTEIRRLAKSWAISFISEWEKQKKIDENNLFTNISMLIEKDHKYIVKIGKKLFIKIFIE